MDYEYGRDEYDLKDMPIINRVPIEEILHQHDKRYVLTTKAHGDVVMRWMPQRMRRIIDAMRLFRYPNYPKLEEEMNILAPLLNGEVDEETQNRIIQISLELQPTYDLYMLGCLEHPFICTMDELDSFLEALDVTESECLREMLMMLSSPAPPNIDDTYFATALRFNVQVVDKHMLDNMTRQQYDIFESILGAERKATEKMYKELGK